MQEPKILLTILSQMAKKPHVKFDKLFQKLYNIELWLMAYEQMAANPGNMTPGSDGKTIDGFSIETINSLIEDLKASRYKPNPARRKYIPKPNGGQRALGIPGFEDKLFQNVIRLILEAIYEPTFSEHSHGFRPERSCHTALSQVKRMRGTRWWIEGDIKGFFDNLNHETLLNILRKRVVDNRFLHIIDQFLKIGYIEDWEYNKTYSGTPQGGPLSPLLSNIYLNEFDQMMEEKIKAFNQGKRRRYTTEYRRVQVEKRKAKDYAQETGDWSWYRRMSNKMIATTATDPMDPNFRRLYYVRYADDWLVGVIGSKYDATALKGEIADFLREELQLELSQKKTLITNAKDRARFLGYDIKRWNGDHPQRIKTPNGVVTTRTCTYKLVLLMPRDKVVSFAREYGNLHKWRGTHRGKLLNQSELEILHTYNAELRGFLGYYALADDLTKVGSSILFLAATSFFRTLAAKRKSTLMKVAKSLKKAANHYVISHEKPDGTIREHRLLSSTKQLKKQKVNWETADLIPNTLKYATRTELGQRLRANHCEWCGTTEGYMEVHHVRKLKDLKGKSIWEKRMIERRRKTMVLCRGCHRALHAGTLNELNRMKQKFD